MKSPTAFDRATNSKFGLVPIFLAVPIFLIFLALVSCTEAAVDPAYSLVDNGYRLARRGKIYWLDNDRVLFYGGNATQGAVGATKNDKNAGEGGTYIWNLKAKTLENISEWEIICYHPDFSRWSLVQSLKNVFRSKVGKFMQEVEPSKDELAMQEQTERVQSNFTCKSYPRSELVPPPSRYRNVVVLREGDGYLYVGSQDLAERQSLPKNLTLYQAKTGKPIQLPITREEAVVVSFSSYRGAYVLTPRMPRNSPIGNISDWPKDLPLVVYLLWADGRMEMFSIPYWPSEYLGGPQLIRAGWIYGGGMSPKTTGLYLFDGKTPSKLDVGFVQEIAVTPDGCKAAVGIQNKPLEMGTPINIKVFDFCVGGK